MIARQNRHLTEAQLLQGIVDPSDLTGQQREHLTNCPDCQAEKEGLDSELLRLGHMATASVPKVEGRYALPARRRQPLRVRFFRERRITWIAAPALTMVLIFLTLFVSKPGQQTRVASVDQQIMDPETLLIDVDRLVENPLPEELQTLVSFTAIDTDEDFMMYIVPTIESDPLTRKPGAKGDSIC